ncbi:GntR family transcriptional regulator [Myceligenerans pegani]|uniref:GntR family transcriptional regulator n=1 Tax=Myceligenerans pegani TaxID=2776917 RepID=A0ABR9N524_9MICO|nr:GntR family transcriptional regulator [Myceligenerans sp. TRM 65318]MBE1878776.1 GntR family transcriptional regulator [Myceligenerans sp. TRM 65318]MBE3021047.1 GntR family transcriptional regulator [Myceligenerans sp. TRM 65318]
MTTQNRKDHADYAAAKEIAAQLRSEITQGRYGPGDRLPSQRKLAEQHNAVRGTVDRAIRILVEEGLAITEWGRGTFVRQQPRWMRFGRRRYSRAMRTFNDLGPFGAEAAAQGKEPFVDTAAIDRILPPSDVAERLEISPDTEVVRRENWYYADAEALQLGVTFSPWSIVEGTPVSHSADMGPEGIYGQFERQGYPITFIREEITARMPNPDESIRLQIPPGVPVIDLWHTGYDDQRRPFETTHFVMRADYSALDYDMPVED